MLLFDTFLYFDMKLISRFFQAIFTLDIILISLRIKFTGISNSNPTPRLTLFPVPHTDVMICKLKKLKLEVSFDLKIYLNYSVGLYHMKNSSILIHVVFFALYSGHLVIADTFLRNRRCPLYTGLTYLTSFIRSFRRNC